MTAVPPVPTIKSPFGSAASSRAPRTVAITLALNPAGSCSAGFAGAALVPALEDVVLATGIPPDGALVPEPPQAANAAASTTTAPAERR